MSPMVSTTELEFLIHRTAWETEGRELQKKVAHVGGVDSSGGMREGPFLPE